MEENFTTVKELSKASGYSLAAIYKWINTHQLPAMRRGNKILVNKETFDVFIEDKQHPRKYGERTKTSNMPEFGTRVPSDLPQLPPETSMSSETDTQPESTADKLDEYVKLKKQVLNALYKQYLDMFKNESNVIIRYDLKLKIETIQEVFSVLFGGE